MKRLFSLFMAVLLGLFVVLFAACGESSYELAVKYGFSGTEEEWLKSLEGERGKDGSTWLSGSGAPSPFLGKAGDFYLDTDSFDFYSCGPDGWKFIGNLIGERGEQGEQGIQGEKGEQGEQGIQGEKGERGEQGIQGEKGERGEQGIQGEKGEQGEQGIQGEKGEQGEQGIQGEKGEQGEQGIQGEKGEQGEQGEKGDRGAGWLFGEGAPLEGIGEEGDCYLDTLTYDVYLKSAEGWGLLGSLRFEEKVTVTFDAGEGKLKDGEQTAVLDRGGSMDLPVPEREGYVFLGWFYGEGPNVAQADDLTIFSRDMTLRAEWRARYELSVYGKADRSGYRGDYISLTGYYGGTKEANFSLWVERDGEEYDAQSENPFLNFSSVTFSDGTFTIDFSFKAAGKFRLRIRAEEDGCAEETAILYRIIEDD